MTQEKSTNDWLDLADMSTGCGLESPPSVVRRIPPLQGEEVCMSYSFRFILTIGIHILCWMKMNYRVVVSGCGLALLDKCNRRQLLCGLAE